MTTKKTKEQDLTKLQKEAEEAMNKVRSSISRLADDVYVVQTEMAKFKEAVTSDIQRLVELREKDLNEFRKR